MAKAYNKKLGFFAQSYEDLDVLDSAVLIMPLVFFSTPSDNRFISTLKQLLKSRERGGMTSSVCLYLTGVPTSGVTYELFLEPRLSNDVTQSDDGVDGKRELSVSVRLSTTAGFGRY